MSTWFLRGTFFRAADIQFSYETPKYDDHIYDTYS